MNLPEVLHEDNTITPLLLLTDVNKLYFTLVNKILITFVNPMITKMKERLEQFLAAENITQAAFADKIHVTRSSITHILSGRNKPGYDFFSGLVRNYPSLNIEWLLTGKGKMYRFDEDRTRATESASSVFTAPYSDGNLFSEEEKATRMQDATINDDSPEKSGEGLFPEEDEDVSDGNILQGNRKQRKAAKIVIFYDDGTYEEFMK